MTMRFLPLLVPALLAAQAPVVTEQTSGTTQLLQAVSAVNDKVVWVSGHGGTVLRSVDGGAQWEAKTVPGAAQARLQFRDVHALSADVAWVMSAGNGKASRIYGTKDGGTTWTEQFVNADSLAFYDCFTFFDAKRGVAFSDAANGRTNILRTEDAGTTWALIPAGDAPPPLEGEGAFAASGGCLVSHGANHAWVATGAPGARLLVTTDAGKHWRPVATPFVADASDKASGGMTATSWLDTKRGIGVGARIAQMRTDTAAAVVGITTDGGTTWTMKPRPKITGSFFGVSWIPGAGKSTAVAATLGGLLLTTDAADSWTALTTAQYWSVGAAGKRAWGVGPNGKITRVEMP